MYVLFKYQNLWFYYLFNFNTKLLKTLYYFELLINLFMNHNMMHV